MRAVFKFFRLLALYFRGHLGDAAVLKLDLFGIKPTDACARRIAGVPAQVPPVTLDQLRALPEGSFGREYARFLEAHAITPIVVRPQVLAEIGANGFALRYMTTHDLIHALLGFDASVAGEFGVLSATVAQDVLRGGEALLRRSQRWSRLVYPRQRAAILAAVARGQELGRRAAFLLALPFEELLARPLADVRREVGVA